MAAIWAYAATARLYSGQQRCATHSSPNVRLPLTTLSASARVLPISTSTPPPLLATLPSLIVSPETDAVALFLTSNTPLELLPLILRLLAPGPLTFRFLSMLSTPVVG